MSKIKDLYAIENDIEDLVPAKQPDFGEIEQAIRKNMVANTENIRDEIKREAEFDGDDDTDEIHMCNFYPLCDWQASTYVDAYIEDQHLDIEPDDYDNLCAGLGDWLAEALEDWKADYDREVMNDSVYMIDELRERNGQC